MKISVITTSYNYAEYIEETINSVINQSYQDWELIIVDDGSSDNSVEIIKAYCEKDSRIKLFQHRNGKNKGLKDSLLLGIENATGDWIAFLESDDFFAPDNLLKKIEIAEKYPEVKLIFNKVQFLPTADSTKNRQLVFEKTQKKLSKMNFPKNMFYDFYLKNKILTFSCVMVEAEALKRTDFNAPVDSFLDWWLWIHLAHKNNFYYIDEELSSWRLHDKSYIKTGKKPFLFMAQIVAYNNVYKKNKKPFKLGLFILFSIILSSTVKVFRFFQKKLFTA